MDEPRFYQRPWVFTLFSIVICGGFYLWQLSRPGGSVENILVFGFDFVICALGMLVWLAFFAQFVLPVRTFRDRQKIFDRLVAHIFRGHGPAIFIENGCSREGLGEKDKKGPGVLWLDSASAAVTRTAAKIENTLGPGVHFTKNGEYLAGTVDLHTQIQRLGPQDKDEVFAQEPDENVETVKIETYREVKKRRNVVSAWTRDGIEVVPNVTVIFKIHSKPIKTKGEPGSRFGYDAEAVRKAVTGEGINPDQLGQPLRQRVPWNQLPSLLAADLWREYLAKFTLRQLFEAEQSLPHEPLAPSRSIPVEIQVQAPLTFAGGGALTGMLHEINSILAHWADRYEFSKKNIKSEAESQSQAEDSVFRTDTEKQTALQIINHMIKLRMTRAEVPVLDDSGQPGTGKLSSPEYQLLQERGLKVISASVSGLRFAPTVEEQLIRQWSATWLKNASAERELINRQRGFVELDERVEAIGAYANSLSKYLLNVDPGRENPKGTLKTLLLRTRDELIKSDRMHRRASMELEMLEAIIQWVEGNGG